MNIALDYDGTYTADPELWLAFVKKALSNGHTVYIVTMRYESECWGKGGTTLKQVGHHLIEDGALPMLDQKLVLGLEVVATGRKAKKPFCEQRGICIDIWIDDNPEAVTMHAEQIWGHASPEGEVIIQEVRSKSALPRLLMPQAKDIDWSE